MKKTKTLIAKAEQGQYQALFLDLGWSRPVGKKTVQIPVGSSTIKVDQVAQYRGLAIWVANELPSRSEQRTIDHQLAKQSSERLLIFHSPDAQDWRWPRHSKLGSVNARLMAHRHTTGQPDPDLETRLESMHIGIDEDPTINELLARMRLVFDQESETASAKAARLMGALYEQLNKAGMDTTQSTQLLARLLFLWFGDDAGMWAEDTFHQWVAEHTTAENLNTKLDELFSVVNNPHADDNILSRPWQLPDEYRGFRYINGGLFAKHLDIPPLDPTFREHVLEACRFDWSIISPAIFGSMFQTVKDAKARRAMGEHYTTEENILKTLRPLFLDELEERLEAAWNDKGQLTRLHKRLGNIRYLDPACGCGNFIIIAYRELRALELRLITRRRELDQIDGINKHEYDPKLQLDEASDTLIKMSHFAGIEIEEWPAAIAETAMLLIDHLANQAQSELLGETLVRLPIDDRNRAKIAHGNALHIDWAQTLDTTNETYVAGNPPFLGDHSRTKEQKQDLQQAWGDEKVLSRLDYVTAWHAIALKFYSRTDVDGRWAFVTTNSITQGDQPARLFQPIFDAGWRIRFAYDTFPWMSEAPDPAGVHCVIIGFDRGEKTSARLFFIDEDTRKLRERKAKNINAYLIDGPNILIESRRKPLSTELTMPKYGNKATDGGNLVVTKDEYAEVAEDPIARKYLRRYVGSRELLDRIDRWCLWLVDSTPEERQESPILRQRIRATREARQKSTAETTREYPHDHLFRQFGITAEQPILVLPEVSSERRGYIPVARLSDGAIPSNKLYGFEDPDGFLFGITSSSMFATWMDAIGGRLESRFSFSSTVTWNNFPLPPMDPAIRNQIIEAGEKVLRARNEAKSMTLAQMYNPTRMPTELRNAHDDLDKIVDIAFGATQPCDSNLERLEILFKRYQELTEAEKLSLKPAGRRRKSNK